MVPKLLLPAGGVGKTSVTGDAGDVPSPTAAEGRTDGRTNRRLAQGGTGGAGCSAASADGTAEPPPPGKMSKTWADGGVTGPLLPHQEQRDYSGWPLVHITRPDGDTVSDTGLENTLGSEINVIKI